MNVKDYIRKLFIVCFPLLGFLVANVATYAHFRYFCLIKLLTGHECWGCGLTRAFAALSHFEFVKAYEYNHLIVIVAPLLFVIWILLLQKEFMTK